MQPSISCNLSPCHQYDTQLSEQRRKFIDEHRADQKQEMQLFTTSPCRHDLIDRIHRHSRKNFSGKIMMLAPKPRRRSKHGHGACKRQIPEISISSKRASSMMYRRASMPRLEANALLGTSCLGLNGGPDRLSQRKGQTQSIIPTAKAIVVTAHSIPRPKRRRRSDVGITTVLQRQPEREQTLISAFQSKLGLGW
jgi:hypothetical protein